MNLYFLMNLFYWLLFLFACDRNGFFSTWGKYLNWATMFSLSSYFNTLLIFIFGIYNSLNYLFLRLTSIILVLFLSLFLILLRHSIFLVVVNVNY
jgi:hypothetical protein